LASDYSPSGLVPDLKRITFNGFVKFDQAINIWLFLARSVPHQHRPQQALPSSIEPRGFSI
jgi:hypothetical protein